MSGNRVQPRVHRFRTNIAIAGMGDAQEDKLLTGAAISQGDQGASVALLQQQLKVWGFDPGAADGIYGKNTAGAVSALQRKLGVPDSGNFDEQTQEAVLRDLQSGTSSVIRQNQNATRGGAGPGGRGGSITTTVATSALGSPWVLGGAIVLAIGGAWYWWSRRRRYTVPAQTIERTPPPKRQRAPRTMIRKHARKTASRRAAVQE